VGCAHLKRATKEKEAGEARILKNFLLEKRKFDKENQYCRV